MLTSACKFGFGLNLVVFRSAFYNSRISLRRYQKFDYCLFCQSITVNIASGLGTRKLLFFQKKTCFKTGTQSINMIQQLLFDCTMFLGILLHPFRVKRPSSHKMSHLLYAVINRRLQTSFDHVIVFKVFPAFLL